MNRFVRSVLCAMNHRLARVAVTVVVLLATSGCVAGNTHTFRHQPAVGEDLGGGRTVLLFDVDDQRAEVIEGGEPAAWVGVQRNGFGEPFPILTDDGRPFAASVRDTLARDLESIGFRVVEGDGAGEGDIAAALERAGADRGLAVVMRAFDSDTYTNITVTWDFEATVFGVDGDSLFTHRLQGAEELEGSFVNPVKGAQQAVPPHFTRLMRNLVVGNLHVRRALVTGEIGPAPPSPGRDCTVQQILEMREMGLSEAQIEAACGEG